MVLPMSSINILLVLKQTIVTETPIATDTNINKSAANAAKKPTGPEEGGSASGVKG